MPTEIIINISPKASSVTILVRHDEKLILSQPSMFSVAVQATDAISLIFHGLSFISC